MFFLNFAFTFTKKKHFTTATSVTTLLLLIKIGMILRANWQFLTYKNIKPWIKIIYIKEVGFYPWDQWYQAFTSASVILFLQGTRNYSMNLTSISRDKPCSECYSMHLEDYLQKKKKGKIK